MNIKSTPTIQFHPDSKPKDGFYLDPFKSINSNNSAWYKNIQMIGKGGNGITFYVLCTGGIYRGQHFALKVFYRISSLERRKRFAEEVKFLKKQNHPSILGHIDDGIFLPESYNFPFVITKYMPLTLEDEIKNGISFQKSLIYTMQLLSAIKFLSESKIIHRDIKPQNIFIDGSMAILGDFGLIKEIKDIDNVIDEDDRELFVQGASGTLSEFIGYVAMPKYYRTPDLIQFANGERALDLRTDIYQLGLVIAEMFTGENPLEFSESIFAPIKLKPIKEIKGQYGKRVRTTIISMLEHDRNNRPSVKRLLDLFSGIYEDFIKAKIEVDGDILSSL
jgi:Serine/threonine protein kinase